MKTKLLTLLFILLISHSYSQENDLNEIKYDYKLQKEYKDTIQNIGEKLTGKWKYLGKNTNGKLIDTMSVSFRNNKETITVVENGNVFELEGNTRKKTNYFYEITYSFKNRKVFYSLKKKYYNENIIEISSCQSIPELIYYNGKIGILFVDMIGEHFEGIIKLTSERLILESGKEYLKLK